MSACRARRCGSSSPRASYATRSATNGTCRRSRSSAVKTVTLAPTWLAGASVRVAVTMHALANRSDLELERERSARARRFAGSKPASVATIRQLPSSGTSARSGRARQRRRPADSAPASTTRHAGARHRPAVLIDDRARMPSVGCAECRRCGEKQRRRGGRGAGGPVAASSGRSHRCSFRRLTRRRKDAPDGQVS